VRAHRECLEYASAHVGGMAASRDGHAADVLSLASSQLKLAAMSAPLAPTDIAEDRAAIGRYLREALESVIDRFLGTPGKMPTRADGRALAKEFSRMLENQVIAGAHSEFIEEIRLEKKGTPP
jgi:hypothetical protein